VDPICVVIGRTRHKMVQAEIQAAARQGARFLELRLDFLARPPDFKRLLQDKPCPVLATVRRPVDGGRWAASEETRRLLLRQAIVAGVDWIDLESDVIGSIPRFGKVKRLVSYHNLQGVPPDLEKIHEAMCQADADVVKIAVRAQSPTDNLRVLALLKAPARPTIAYCMGDMGLPSRILGGKLGAPFTYAAFNPERTIAPGLPSFRDLRAIYHYEHVNAETQVFGVVGDPVAHSLSPLIHNQAFRELGINAVYLPFRVPRSEFVSTIKAFERLDVRGYSVTIPHKETAAVMAVVKDDAVTRTQAANTLVRRATWNLAGAGTGVTTGLAAHKDDGGFAAYNTDFQGAIEALRANLPANPPPPDPFRPLAGRSALVLGSGGIARAVTFALLSEGVAVTISNRTPERAEKLAQEARCKHIEWGGRHNVLCDLLVNCTSVGMHPNLDECPVHHSLLKHGMIVFDTVYTPETTLLVKEAKERGCHVVTGVELFVRQAALQFRLFTGREPPTELFRKVVKRALSPVTIKGDEHGVPE
jgi:3-dehydroquinate dehydratase/shikimate dehydrogenase